MPVYLSIYLVPVYLSIYLVPVCLHHEPGVKREEIEVHPLQTDFCPKHCLPTVVDEGKRIFQTYYQKYKKRERERERECLNHDTLVELGLPN